MGFKSELYPGRGENSLWNQWTSLLVLVVGPGHLESNDEMSITALEGMASQMAS